MIMRFYEVLTELMVKHKLKGVQIYDKLGIKKSYFSKIKNGSILPPDFLMVLALCNTMGLDELEREQMSITTRMKKSLQNMDLLPLPFINYTVSDFQLFRDVPRFLRCRKQ